MEKSINRSDKIGDLQITTEEKEYSHDCQNESTLFFWSRIKMTWHAEFVLWKRRKKKLKWDAWQMIFKRDS